MYQATDTWVLIGCSGQMVSPIYINMTGSTSPAYPAFLRQGDSDHGLHWSIQNLHILAGISSLDILYLEGKSPLLMSNNRVNFGDILPETSKSSAFWYMGVNSHLKWLLLFSPYEAGKWGRHQSKHSYAYFNLLEGRLVCVTCSWLVGHSLGKSLHTYPGSSSSSTSQKLGHLQLWQD